MQSKILQIFGNLFHALAIWFDASLAGRLFNRFSAFLARSFADSLPGRFFVAKGTSSVWNESLFYKLLHLPVSLCRLIAGKIGDRWQEMAKSSCIVWFLMNWNIVSIRIYGFLFGSFALCYGALRICLSGPDLLEIAILSAVLLFAVFAVIINRSLKSLFKGSRFLTAFGSMFCPIRKDVDSKLFMKDPEFLLRPLAGILIGILFALLAFFFDVKLLLLALAGSLFVALVLRSVFFGVFVVIMVAPILPTMVLAACCVLVIISFFLHLATEKDMTLRPVPLGGFVAVFALTMVLGTLLSFTFMKSMQILFLHLAFIGFYFVVFQTLDTPKKWRSVLVAFLFVSGLVALYGIYQNFAGVSSTASWVDKEMFNQIKTRVYSTFDNPNVLGEYLVLMIPVALACICRSQTDGRKTIYAGLLACLGLCMVFTWSRGAWLGMILAVALFLLIMDKRWALLGVVGLLLLPALLGSNSAIANRIFSIGNTADTSTAYRVSIWRASITMIRDFWISGIGPGSDAFAMIYPKYALAGANFALHSHNLFLQLWVELGIVGFASFIALILAFMRQTLSLACYQNRGRLTGTTSIALTAGLLGFLLQGLTDNVWYNYKMVLLFWIILAFASSVAAPDFDPSNCEEGSRV
ncbi:MAG: O-antigen ligase family protein [Clostridia bacterium]|nr:O-antigen ligase family protein [Clostridia bacterium]